MLVTIYGLLVVVASIPLTYVTRRLPRRALLCGLLAAFVLSTVVTAASPSYGVLVAARLGTALSQALFWSIVLPTAMSLFDARRRGRVGGVMAAGNSLATVLGVPLGTVLGQHAGWRTAFLALSAVGLLVLVGAVFLLPPTTTSTEASPRGKTPDVRRYVLLMATTTLAVTGAFAAFTYITPFLREVTELSAGSIGPVLFVRGLAGVAGAALGGALIDRSPVGTTVLAVVLQALALLGLYVWGRSTVLSIVMIATTGLSFAVLLIAVSVYALDVAPMSHDLANSGTSTAVNVGIAVGALAGGLLLPGFGVRSTVVVGALLSFGAVATALVEFRSGSSRGTPPRRGAVPRTTSV
jgi:predicted MFS family arabinose efflux permease